MKAADLKRWMETYKKSAVDVASMLKIEDTRPITNFLDGKTMPRKILLNALEELIRSKPDQSPTHKTA